MKTFICEKIPRIVKNKKKLEAKLNVKITNRGKEIFIEGKSVDEHIAEKVFDALEFGFPYFVAMLIKEEDCEFEVLNIKDYTNRKNRSQIRGRIIGRQGKVLKVLSDLTNCHFEIKENNIGIIGYPEEIKNAREAIVMIIQGSKQSNVYKHLEKNHPKQIEDFGLKHKRLE
jgi:ribosomal RNA assembly protein